MKYDCLDELSKEKFKNIIIRWGFRDAYENMQAYDLLYAFLEELKNNVEEEYLYHEQAWLNAYDMLRKRLKN